MLKRTFSALILAALVVLPSGVLAQLDDTQAWATHNLSWSASSILMSRMPSLWSQMLRPWSER
jgi:hypothetical protein